MSTTVLARKWRPKNFAQLAGQEHVVKALSNALAQNRLHHAYLFTGTRGVGKTTIARIFAKSLNCATGITANPCGECSACKEIDSGRFIDLIELDAASNTQVDSMRELLESALYAPNSGRFKVYIIDEVHMLSRSAFNAMLKTLEEPPGHVKFILATTDPQKIPVTVLSRCLQFNLKQLPPALIFNHLQHVLQQEGIAFESAAVQLIARAAQGSMRDALSLMDQAIAFAAGKVEESIVRNMLGAIDRDYLFNLLEALRNQDGAAMLTIAENMATRSVAFDGALQELATLLHRIALAQTVPQAIAEDDLERARLLDFAQAFTADDVQLYYQIAIHGRNEIELAPDEFAGFTMTLLRMLAFAPGKVMAPRVRPVQQEVPAAIVEKITATQQTTELVPPPVSPANMDWASLMQVLNLQSMAQQLARHCTLESLSDNQVVLCLAPDNKHLQTKMAVEKLQSAFCEYFAKPIVVKINYGQATAVTPAILEQQIKDTKQQQANASIAADTFVQNAQREFGASVVAESIKPIE